MRPPTSGCPHGGAGILAAAAALALSSCAAVPACSGPPPRASRVAELEITADMLLAERTPGDLSCWAEAGDPVSQFTLGRAYELGRGVAPDKASARRYYKLAARGRPTRLIYSPPLPGERYGRVLSVPGSSIEGLPEAKAALDRLGDDDTLH